MKKIYALLAVGVASAILVAFPGSIRSGTDEPTKPKSYELTLVEKGKKIKVFTPTQIQSGSAAPEEFSVYTTGKIEDVEITLIDANKSESFDEKGVDLFILGKSICALPVSRVISFKNKLYECEVEPNGERITLSPYDGDTGEVDMLSNFKSTLKPEMLILKSGDIYLDVGKSKNALVPCGSYNLWLGYIADKKCSMAIKSREMKAIDVVKGEDKDGKKNVVKIQWGAPYRLDCNCSLGDNNITITEGVSVYGSAGEEYSNFTASLLPAAIEIFDSTKKSVAKGAINKSVTATTQNPNTEVKGGYSGVIKKGAVPPYTLKILVKNSVLGELKGEKEIK